MRNPRASVVTGRRHIQGLGAFKGALKRALKGAFKGALKGF